MDLSTAARREAPQLSMEMIMTRSKRSKTGHGRYRAQGIRTHPHGVATIVPPREYDELPDQPFAEGAGDQLDPDLRHRLISEAAFHRQTERGYDAGYDRDDWLEAETAVDHLVVGPKSG